jgi:lipopolysaccharide export system protein LptC
VIRQGFLSLAAILVIGLLVIMLLNELDHVRIKTAIGEITAPDIVLQGADLRTYDAEGRLEYRVSAGRIEHRDGPGQSLLETPVMEVRTGDEIWLVSASHGEVDQRDRLLTLYGEVEARLDGPDPVVLNTSRLLYHVRRHVLEIPASVTISHPGGETRAGQLEADLGAGTLIMQQGVETRYAPDA